MVTRSPVKMAHVAPSNGSFDDDFERDIDALLREQQQNRAVFDLDRDELNICRSGSAPPTVEGSRTAFGGLFGPVGFPESHGIQRRGAGTRLSDEEMRLHPDYSSYYYSNAKLNPRMPPPAVSKEDWRARQRFQAGASSFGGIGDHRGRKDLVEADVSGSSLFSLQPGFPKLAGQEEMLEPNGLLQQNNLYRKQTEEWFERNTDGLIGLPDVGLGARRKSFADALQEELIRPASAAGHYSHPVSRNAYEDNDSLRLSSSRMTQLDHMSEAASDVQSGAFPPSLVRVRSLGSSISHSFAAAADPSLTRNTNTDPLLIQRVPSPCLPPVGARNNDIDKHIGNRPNNIGDISSSIADCNDIAAAMLDLNLSTNIITEGESLLRRQNNQSFPDHHQFLQDKVIHKSDSGTLRTQVDHFMGQNGISYKAGTADAILSKLAANGKIDLSNQSAYRSPYKQASSMDTASLLGSKSQHLNFDKIGVDFDGLKSMMHPVNHELPSMLNNQLDMEGHRVASIENQLKSGFEGPITESPYGQYSLDNSDPSVHATGYLNPSLGGNFRGSSHIELPEYQNGYMGNLVAHQKGQYGVPLLSKYSGLNNGLYGNHNFGIGMPYPASQISTTTRSLLNPGSQMRLNERISRIPSTLRNPAGATLGPWIPESSAMGEGYSSSFLEEFKSNKNRTFELSDIIGHAVEFSKDQFGSRFIQQKLETASVEEKDAIFPEINSSAHALMTDVFGNYVVQKFFEHGTEIQRKELAIQLTGHVLPLSLQMYGCRVIQKALEVVDVDQQAQMVLELDGQIMKCVRDQNGNHVIQKCIECIPQENIQFIIEAFYGHVVTLSTHPYGCRVIQRVLEHCNDPEVQTIMMDEIMGSVCTLAQDQYGNYVIQHVLQHGKPEERSAIISKLVGQIVKMSQQKYASNVVEKCLTYGTPEERQLLISEMLGSTDENEHLEAMMKDQFANYVVQKVLETCDDNLRELILARIKVHLNALKRYTYGKHIVARVEKLVAAGEKRIGLSSYSS
ncbi:hypothetical protein Cni_G27760 [Canna indica]|uniref:PUM-HD domain-containing protein n=1 Tax=Canna indica TaxID=4628 RepID=A0AAQ3L1D4_9LILI|nr:hypothetical protein Cni_G27760 [Canna indica]